MIKFDSVKALNDFKKSLKLTLIQLQGEILADAEGKMLTPEGRADIAAGPIEEIAGIISAFVVEGPWAVMDEYGRGSLMDSQNPFLEAYRRGELWNPARFDLVIRGRPAGSYTNIFGETAYSSGRQAGRNLERIGDVSGDSDFMPHPPSHAMQTAFRWMASGRFQKVIGQAFQSFPWENYLIVRSK